jgi:hypothetical protein
MLIDTLVMFKPKLRCAFQRSNAGFDTSNEGRLAVRPIGVVEVERNRGMGRRQALQTNRP